MLMANKKSRIRIDIQYYETCCLPGKKPGAFLLWKALPTCYLCAVETARIVYQGELETVATHAGSGVSIRTDAPPDNQGKGSSFSPTDLLAASLGCCMLTVMGIKARDHGIRIEGARIVITKVMASEPRRVSSLVVEVLMPSGSYQEKEKVLLERTALHCPVAKSLHPDIQQRITFRYQD